jgi:hypothetical protein
MKKRAIFKQFGILRRSEDGQALLLTALGVMVLLLMAGLGIDVAYLRYQQQHMQKAADAGAIAGASALEYNGDWSDAGLNESSANGFQNGQNGITVNVYNPPQDGPYQGDPTVVEVIVSQRQPTFFMRVGGFTSVSVRARAVAAASKSASGCIYVLDPTDSATYTASGSADVNVNCGVLVESQSSSAYDDSGGACTTATYIGIVGGIQQDNCTSPTPTTGIATFSDPEVTLPAPVSTPVSCPQTPPSGNPSSCTYQPNGGLTCNSTPSPATAEIQPGTYCGGITISGSNTTVHFAGGTYVLAGGGLQVQGGANVISDAGVTFFNTTATNNQPGYKPIVVSGGSTTSLSAPTSGTYAGILFFQDRTLPSQDLNQQNTVSGGSGAFFEGILYFPTTPLVYSGGGNTTDSPYTEIIAWSLTISGNSAFNNPYEAGDLPVIHTATLVE